MDTTYITHTGTVTFDPEEQEISEEGIIKAKEISEDDVEKVFDWHDEYIYKLPGYSLDRSKAHNKELVLADLKRIKAL